MRNAKGMIVMLLCTFAILTIGYMGIIFFGERVMKSSSEPESVTMEGNITSLFYSKLENNVEFFPWNYYIPEKKKMESEMGVFHSDSSYVQEEVFYDLIAQATGAKSAQIEKKYERKKYNIRESMVQGEKDGELLDLYFYKRIIRVKKQKYRVSIACDKKSIISFYCAPVVEGGMTAAKDWKEKKDLFIKKVEGNQEDILEAFAYAYNTFYAEARGKKKLDIKELKKKEDAIQVMELTNRTLLVIEADITVGLYYDVLGERVAGFHFFMDED